MREAGRDSQAYTVSVGNLVLGVYVFLVLRLPSEWRLVKGGMPAEFVYSKELDGARWVTEGQAYHYLYNRSNGSKLELTLKCIRGPWKGGHPRTLTQRGQGRIELSGHPGAYLWGNLRGGLLRKEEVTYLNLFFTCDRTERTVQLEMKGRASQDDIRSLTEAIAMSQCHTV